MKFAYDKNQRLVCLLIVIIVSAHDIIPIAISKKNIAVFQKWSKTIALKKRIPFN